MKRVDLTARRFGMLKVTSFNRSERLVGSHYAVTWNCQCDCGNKTEVRGIALKHGRTTSCGCKQKRRGKDHPKWKGHGSISGDIWNTYKTGARNRGFEFTVSIEHAWELFEAQHGRCALSGRQLSFTKTNKKWTLHTASLDRIDSSKGYLVGNLQWLHKEVNRMKGAMSDKDFVSLCKAIFEYRGTSL